MPSPHATAREHPVSGRTSGPPDRVRALLDAFRGVRRQTEALAAPLSPEDQQVQSMPDASPVKWHLAHTTWFFETFVLAPNEPGFAPHHPGYGYLFNSYYEAVGARHPRPRRGLVTRPSLMEVCEWRADVDARVERLLDADLLPDAALDVVELGLHHEQQHQELVLTDVKHLLFQNPLRPAYRAEAASTGSARTAAAGETGGSSGAAAPAAGLRWIDHPGGIVEIGHGGEGFAFDNEGPRHRVFLEPFQLASRLVTCAELLAFMEDGGYRRPELWLSDGWAAVQERGWEAPLYWERRDADVLHGGAERDGGSHGDAAGSEWTVFTLAGPRPLDPAEPVCHVSFFEADAYARWAGARLPSEEEWEVLAAAAPPDGTTAADGRFHPAPARAAAPRASAGAPGQAGTRAALLLQAAGDCWQWTRSAYGPYPGYAPVTGALGEYNGKFMSGQMVLRGASCATPAGHSRPTYRNFFHPPDRWQFSGIRLARDAT